jgi:hypothetical protein
MSFEQFYILGLEVAAQVQWEMGLGRLSFHLTPTSSGLVADGVMSLNGIVQPYSLPSLLMEEFLFSSEGAVRPLLKELLETFARDLLKRVDSQEDA